jgi:GNAT superfamily N-acetyltransferase
MTQMEPSVRKAVGRMGYTDSNYHLRQVAAGINGFSLRSALVLFKGTHPIGWAAMYMDCQYRHCSVWVNPRQRGKGYGVMLMHSAYKYWRRFNPETHGIQREKWKDWDMRVYK